MFLAYVPQTSGDGSGDCKGYASRPDSSGNQNPGVLGIFHTLHSGGFFKIPETLHRWNSGFLLTRQTNVNLMDTCSLLKANDVNKRNY